MELLFLIPAVAWLILANWLHQVLGLPFGRARVSRSGSDVQVPEAFSDRYEAAHERLRELGMSGPFLAELETDWPGGPLLHCQSLWLDRERGVAVYLLPPDKPQAPDCLNVIFLSRLSDGRLVLSQAFDPFLTAAAEADEWISAQTIGGEGLGDQLQMHLDWVARKAQGTAPALLGRAGMQPLLAHVCNRLRQNLLRKRWLRSAGDGLARPGLIFGLRLLKHLFRQPRPPASETPVSPGRLHHFARLRLRSRDLAPSRGHQYGLFAGSAAAFVLLGAVIFDVQFAIVLALVITVHELGHYLAMRAFGYRQVRMMLLPLVGGVTIGHEQRPDPVRRGWVSMMGPLPGIVLGAILLYWLQGAAIGAGASEWLTLLAWLLLFVNYLNLLPVPPLDGGRIVEDLLPARWLWLRVPVVVVLCGAGVLVSIWLGLWLLALIALLPLLALPGFVTAARTARHVEHELRGLGDEAERRVRILSALAAVAGPPRDVNGQLELAEAVDRLLPDQSPGRMRYAALGASFLLVLAAPLGTTVAASLLWIGLVADPLSEPNALTRVWEQTEEEFSGLSTEQLIERALPRTKAADGVDESRLNAARERLGGRLPPLLRQLYRSSDGIERLGLWPLALVATAPDCLQQRLAEYERRRDAEGFDPLTVFAEGRQFRVDPRQLGGWLCIGSEDDNSRWLVARDASVALPQLDQQFLVFHDHGVEAYADLETWLRGRLVNQAAGRRQQALLDARMRRLESELEDATVDHLLDRMPSPGWLERRAFGLPGLPGPADPRKIEAVQDRLGIELPVALRALYARHDGYRPWAVSPLAQLDRPDPAARQMLLDRLSGLMRPPDGVADRIGEWRAGHIDLSACLILGWSVWPEGSAERAGNGPTLLWCPPGDQIDHPRVADFELGRLYADLSAHFRYRTAWRLQHEG